MFALPVDLAGAWFSGVPLSLSLPGFNASFRVIVIRSKFKLSRRLQFNTITKDLIGNTWNIISGITVAFVLYILTYAYISANGAIISETISMNLGYHANPRIVGICTAISLPAYCG